MVYNNLWGKNCQESQNRHTNTTTAAVHTIMTDNVYTVYGRF